MARVMFTFPMVISYYPVILFVGSFRTDCGHIQTRHVLATNDEVQQRDEESRFGSFCQRGTGAHPTKPTGRTTPRRRGNEVTEMQRISVLLDLLSSW